MMIRVSICPIAAVLLCAGLAAQQPVTVEYDRGVRFKAGEHSLRMATRLQLFGTYAETDPGTTTNNWGVRNARTDLDGESGKFDYKVQIDWRGNENIRAAWVRWTFVEDDDKEVEVRGGLQKPEFGLEGTQPFWGSATTMRSIAGSWMSSDNRSGGIKARGTLAQRRVYWHFGGLVGDVAGGSSALESGPLPSNADGEINWYGGVRWDLNGDLGDFEELTEGDLDRSEQTKGAVGANIEIGNHKAAAAGPDIETTAIDLYTTWYFKGFNIWGEYFQREDEVDGGVSSDHDGWTIAVNYHLEPGPNGGQWGFGARYSMVTNDDASVLLTSTFGLGGAVGDVTDFQIYAGHYCFGHDMKVQLALGRLTVDPSVGGDVDTDYADLQFQISF